MSGIDYRYGEFNVLKSIECYRGDIPAGSLIGMQGYELWRRLILALPGMAEKYYRFHAGLMFSRQLPLSLGDD